MCEADQKFAAERSYRQRANRKALDMHEFSFTMSKNDHIAVKVSRKLSSKLNRRWIAVRAYR
jgi:hypothetical protein